MLCSSPYNLCPSSGGAPRMWAEGEGVGVDWSQKSRSDSGWFSDEQRELAAGRQWGSGCLGVGWGNVMKWSKQWQLSLPAPPPSPAVHHDGIHCSWTSRGRRLAVTFLQQFSNLYNREHMSWFGIHCMCIHLKWTPPVIYTGVSECTFSHACHGCE